MLSKAIFLSTLPIDQKGRLALAILVITGVIYLVISGIYTVRNIKEDDRKGTWIVDVVFLIGGLLYFVGDNYPTFVRQYGAVFNCDRSTACFEMVEASEAILLGMAVVFYRLIPFCVNKYFNAKYAKDKEAEVEVEVVPEWIMAAESLTLLVEFNTWFTVVGMSPSFSVAVGNSSVRCPSTAYTTAIWVFWFFYVLMYVFILQYVVRIQYQLTCDINCSCIGTNIGIALLWVTVAFFLLADNFLPLGCTGYLKGRETEDTVVKLVLLVFVFIMISLAIAAILVYRCLPVPLQEKLLPSVLLQYITVKRDNEEAKELKEIEQSKSDSEEPVETTGQVEKAKS